MKIKTVSIKAVLPVLDLAVTYGLWAALRRRR